MKEYSSLSYSNTSLVSNNIGKHAYKLQDNRSSVQRFEQTSLPIEKKMDVFQLVKSKKIKKKNLTRRKINTQRAGKPVGIVKPQKVARVAKSKNPDFNKRAVSGLAQGRMRYLIGQHGAKVSEQKRLKLLHNKAVSGDTHESEHTIGYAVLAGGHLPRNESRDAQILENIAPAYQEVKVLHRDHIGTGSSSTRDETGMNADEYRLMQRGLLVGDTPYNQELANRTTNPIGVSSTEKGNAVSNAVQINQLGYGHQLNNRQYSNNPTELLQANNSYSRMVRGMQSVTYAKDSTTAEAVGVSDASKLEMVLARYAATTGKWPKDEAEKLNKLLDQSKLSGIFPQSEVDKVLSTLKIGL